MRQLGGTLRCCGWLRQERVGVTGRTVFRGTVFVIDHSWIDEPRFDSIPEVLRRIALAGSYHGPIFDGEGDL